MKIALNLTEEHRKMLLLTFFKGIMSEGVALHVIFHPRTISPLNKKADKKIMQK